LEEGGGTDFSAARAGADALNCLAVKKYFFPVVAPGVSLARNHLFVFFCFHIINKGAILLFLDNFILFIWKYGLICVDEVGRDLLALAFAVIFVLSCF